MKDGCGNWGKRAARAWRAAAWGKAPGERAQGHPAGLVMSTTDAALALPSAGRAGLCCDHLRRLGQHALADLPRAPDRAHDEPLERAQCLALGLPLADPAREIGLRLRRM